MQQALLTAREGGTAQGIHSVTTDQNVPGTNQSQVLSSSSWKEQALPLTAPSYPPPPSALGVEGVPQPVLTQSSYSTHRDFSFGAPSPS